MSLPPNADQCPLDVMAALASGDPEQLEKALAAQRADLVAQFGEPSTWTVIPYEQLSDEERHA